MTNVYEALIIEKESRCQAKNKDFTKLWYLYTIVTTNTLQVPSLYHSLVPGTSTGTIGTTNTLQVLGLYCWLLWLQQIILYLYRQCHLLCLSILFFD